MNFDYFLAFTGGNKQLAKQAVHAFVASGKEMLQQLSPADSRESVQFVAHKIKPFWEMLGHADFVTTCQLLENPQTSELVFNQHYTPFVSHGLALYTQVEKALAAW